MGYNQVRGPRNDRSDPSRHEPAGMSARSGGPPRGTVLVLTLPQFFRGVHRLDQIETHHLRFLSIEKSVYRRGSGSTSRKGCQLRRVGRACGTAASAHARDQGARRSRWTRGWPTSRVIGPCRPEPPRAWCFCFSPTSGAPGGLFCFALLWPGPGAPQPRREIHPVAVVPYEGTTMQTPLQITFHNLPHSKVIESAIQEAADRLEDTHDRITSCRVIVDQPHRHHKEGNLFQVRIDLKMPGAELVVKREHAGTLASGDLSLVIQDAFEEMQGQIEEFVNRRRGFVKTHEDLPHA